MSENTFQSTAAMRAIAACIRADVPVFAKGEPGEAKSAKLVSWLRAWGRHVEVINGSTREGSDFLGLPTIEDSATEYAPLRWVRDLNAHEHSALILEEFTCTAEDTQKAMLRGLEERVWGDTPVTTDCPIVVIGNPTDVAVGAYAELPAPVANRMCHVEWGFDFDEWADGMIGGFENLTVPSLTDLLGEADPARRAKVASAVVQFLRTNPQFRRKGYAESGEDAGAGWYSPRSWSKAVDVLSQLHPSDDAAALVALKGLVGQSAARTFTVWASDLDLYDPQEVIDNPTIVRWDTDRPDRLYVLAGSITALCRSTGDKGTWIKAMKAMNHAATRDRADVAWPGVRSLLEVKPRDVGVPTETVDAFGPLLAEVGLIEAEDTRQAA